MTSIIPNMDAFTCISCRVLFKDAELQRLHYKTDWHRYNLKRKIADLPPTTAEEFQRRVNNQRNQDQILQQSTTVYCQVCRKSFGTSNAYDNHLNSKKHKLNEVSFDPNEAQRVEAHPQSVKEEKSVDEDVEEVDSDEWEGENPIDNNDCLFCSHHSRNFIKNLEHMTQVHSFFVPDIEYCTDINGLLTYLGEKVSQGFMCLWCNDKGRTFHTMDAAKAHMVDKGHCKMLHEGIALAEYADFYDYSSSYPDNNEEVDVDSEVDLPVLEESEYQLRLPSGVTVGHRSLMRYYKQSFNPNSVVVVKPNKKLHKVLASYRALGWTETQQKEAAKKARDLHYMKRLQSKYNMKMGVKANKFQPHFRQQVNY